MSSLEAGHYKSYGRGGGGIFEPLSFFDNIFHIFQFISPCMNIFCIFRLHTTLVELVCVFCSLIYTMAALDNGPT